MIKNTAAALLLILSLNSCTTENYSNGDRIGMVTKFSKCGYFWKSWEGHLNLTQTGMNTSGEPFEFSIDNDREDQNVINIIDSAARNGWKVKLTYHETLMKNWFSNRGETNHFITKVEVLEKNPVSSAFGHTTDSIVKGRVDTIYLVIYRK